MFLSRWARLIAVPLWAWSASAAAFETCRFNNENMPAMDFATLKVLAKAEVPMQLSASSADIGYDEIIALGQAAPPYYVYYCMDRGRATPQLIEAFLKAKVSLSLVYGRANVTLDDLLAVDPALLKNSHMTLSLVGKSPLDADALATLAQRGLTIVIAY